MTALVAASVAIVVLASATRANSDATAPSGASSEQTYNLSQPLLGTSSLFDVSTLQGRPIVINFWASWCPPCNAEAPTLAAAYDKWSAKGVAFVGVDSTDTAAAGEAFIQKYGWKYPVVEDSSGDMQIDWGVEGLPTTFFIDPTGNIIAQYSGGIDAESLDSYIQKIATS